RQLAVIDPLLNGGRRVLDVTRDEEEVRPAGDQARRGLLGLLRVELRVDELELELPPVDAAGRIDLLDLELRADEAGRVERRHCLRQVECPADRDRLPRRRAAPRAR